jgi:radical SAM superfamily enzyme YgiQ (UPF0313 family)
MGCNFCSTSAMFGGKGRFVNFYDTGDELFATMCDIEARLGVNSFFVLDENFLFHRKRALRLLELLEAHEKSWSLLVFSSARVLASYTLEQLVGLGLSWVWMGLEGEESRYGKLAGVDTHALVRRLQENGIRVLGSTIIGLEEHDDASMAGVIEYAVSHATDFHQFMLYTPLPGTPLYAEMEMAGALLPESECDPADAHGQSRFNYRHPRLRAGGEGAHLLAAFERDLEVNGPSFLRLTRTMLAGFERYRDDPSPRQRQRWHQEGKTLITYTGGVWATRRWYLQRRRAPHIVAMCDALLRDLVRVLGWRARLAAPLVGAYAYHALAREERRLARGWRYEPRTFREENAAARALAPAARRGS